MDYNASVKILFVFLKPMTTTILILIACSTVITSIVNAAKPWYKKFAGNYTVTVSVALSFVLGIICRT